MTGWLIGFLPDPVQPYAGFLIAILVAFVGFIAFFQPIIGLFRKSDSYTPSTGDSALDALLLLDARGKLNGEKRETLTTALLMRVSHPEGATESPNTAVDQSKRVVVERIVDAPATEQKSALLETLLVSPDRAFEDMMSAASTAQEYVDIGILAMTVDAATARKAFDLALALEPDNPDAAVYALKWQGMTGGTAALIPEYEALLANIERTRPDLTVLILLELARQANIEDRWEDAQRQYRRAISVAEATHDMERLAAACIAVADDMLSFVRPLRKDIDTLPMWVMDDADAMLAKAHSAIASMTEDVPHLIQARQLSSANLKQILGKYDEAEDLIGQALEGAGSTGDKLLEARALALTAIIQHKSFHLFAAIESIDEAITLVQRFYDGMAVDTEIPNAPFLRLKGDLLLDNAQHDDALVYYRRAYQAYEKSGSFDDLTRSALDTAIFQCRLVGDEGFTKAETDEAAQALNVDDNDTSEPFDLEKRLQKTRGAFKAGILDAEPSEEAASSADDAAPFFSADEDEKLEQASNLYVSGKDRFENEDWENAAFALNRARELFNEIDALPPDTEADISAMLDICARKIG